MNEALTTLSPYVRLAHDFHTPRGMEMAPCWINDHALHFFKAGSGSYQIGEETYPIEAGTVFLVPPGLLFSIRAAPGTAFHMLNVHFDLIERADSIALNWPYPRAGERRQIPAQERMDTLPHQIVIPDTAAFEWLFSRVHRLFGLRDLVSALQIKSAMVELLAHLFQVAQQGTRAAGMQQHEPAMQAAMRYMKSHYQEPLRLSDVAVAASLSDTHFASLFKAFFGASPIKFVTQLRIERVKLELGLGNLPIKQIAQIVGYESVHHFSRAFKQHTGIAPALFRRMYAPRQTAIAE